MPLNLFAVNLFCKICSRRALELWLLSGFVLAAMLWLPSQINAQQDFLATVRNLIEQQVESERQQKGFSCQGEIICGLKIIPIIYQQRGYTPVWFDDKGLRPIAKALIKAIREADQDGLIPSDYHLQAIERILEEEATGRLLPHDVQAKQWADVDLILTDAYLILGSHLSAGRVNPEKIHEDWLVGPKSFGMLTALNNAVTEAQIQLTFDELRPIHRGYVDLKTALKTMRILAENGGWPKLKKARHTIRPTETDQDVATIRHMLETTGDFPKPFNIGPWKKPSLYDKTLARAVQTFQKRHGLRPDGLIGKKTRNAMSFTIDQRIRQIELNLERWRWFPDQLGHRYMIINAADFTLKIINNSRKELEMKVVVGRPERQSPVFSSKMSHMVLNPYWNVPQKIAVEDILPKLAEGVDYLADHGITVLADWSKDAEELEPETIDWGIYDEHFFPLRLRQEPGKKNALGQIKFMFPNKFAVYLHDTPNKSHFRKFQRGYSSGCIRVENAPKLANFLLSGNRRWTPKKLAELLEEGERQVVGIPDPLTIHIFYMTAWVDDVGALQFREDIYERDAMLDEALQKRKPYPLPSAPQFVNHHPKNWMDNKNRLPKHSIY